MKLPFFALNLSKYSGDTNYFCIFAPTMRVCEQK